VSAVGTHAREHVRPTDPPGSDADAWFSALDDRTIELGPTTCMARVQGIHTGPDGLWIQLSCEGHTEISVVVHVTTATRVEDVLIRLKTDPPVGQPLEIVDPHGRFDTSSTQRLSGRPTPRKTD
jgi:hypothetical protein